MTTCIFEDHFLESDRFLAYALHSLTSVEIPIHIFGAYLITYKTPRSMSTAKYSILQLHIVCTIMDLMITSLWIFYIWIPAPAGYPVGLMSYFGISSMVQAFIAFDVMLAVALSYVSFFENRYDAVVIGQIGRSKRRNIWRILYFGLNILYVQLTMGFILYHFPNQEESRIYIGKKLPCIPLTNLNNPNFVNLNSNLSSIPFVTSMMVLIICLQAFYFVIYTAYHLFTEVANVSKSTRTIQRKFFVAMFLQAAIPSISFAAPLYSYYIFWRMNYYNQMYNNFAMITIGCNGLLTTLVMIIVHHPYRNAVKEMFGMRKMERQKTTVATLNLRPIHLVDHELVVISDNKIINDHKVKIIKSDDQYLTTIWEDKTIELIELVKYIADIFNYPAVSYGLSNYKCVNRPLTEWTKQKFIGKVEHCKIYSEPRPSSRLKKEKNYKDFSSEDVKYILDTAKISKNCIFESKPCPDFRYEFINFNLKYIELKGAKWLTLDDLIALSNQSIYITLMDTSITNQELNLFWKQWTSSRSVLKMKQLQYEHSEQNLNEILLDIPIEKRDPDQMDHFKLKGEQPIYVWGGLNLKRTNGDTAFIKTTWGRGIFFGINYSSSQ